MRKFTTAQRLKQIMNEQNLRQIDILNKSISYQEKLGVKMTSSHLSNYINARVTPSAEILNLLAKTLNVPHGWLLGYREKRKNTKKEGTKTMALKLTLKKSIFPIEIGEFKFEVDLSDDKTEAFEEKVTTFLTGITQLVETPDNQSEFSELLQNVFDGILGNGAYDQLYNYAKRDDILAELLEELVLALVAKLPGRQGLIDGIKAAKIS